MINFLRIHKRSVTTILAITGIGIMGVYSLCSESCAYLEGTLFEVDLKYLGIFFMTLVLAAGALGMDVTCALLLSLGMGGELFLLGFQVMNGVYCPYCLAFAAIAILLFTIWVGRISPSSALLFAAAGFSLFYLFFSGSVSPAYADHFAMPPLGVDWMRVREIMRSLAR